MQVKRRLVDTVRSSPTKDDLYTELNDANAKLLQSEGETQRVKAIMSAKCNATISTYMQQFRVAAGQFQILSQEIFQSEENTSKTILEQRVNDMASLLETQSFAQEEQAVQFRQYTESLENHANAEFSMFKQAAGVRMEHALAEQQKAFHRHEIEKRQEDTKTFREEATSLVESRGHKDQQIAALELRMQEMQASQSSIFHMGEELSNCEEENLALQQHLESRENELADEMNRRITAAQQVAALKSELQKKQHDLNLFTTPDPKRELFQERSQLGAQCAMGTAKQAFSINTPEGSNPPPPAKDPYQIDWSGEVFGPVWKEQNLHHIL